MVTTDVPIKTLLLLDTGHLSTQLWSTFCRAFVASNGGRVRLIEITSIANDFNTDIRNAVNELRATDLPVCVLIPPVDADLQCCVSPDAVLSEILEVQRTATLSNPSIIFPGRRNTNRNVALYLTHTHWSNPRYRALPYVACLHTQMQVFHSADLDVKPLAWFVSTRIPKVGNVLDTHLEMALATYTPAMMVIDEFCILREIPRIPQSFKRIYSYQTINPYNGLVYEHGAPRIFPVPLLRSLVTETLPLDADFYAFCAQRNPLGSTTIEQAVGVHEYAQHKHVGARVAYQEAYRLQKLVNDESVNNAERTDGELRLRTWTTDKNYASSFRYQATAARLGARHAREGWRAVNDVDYMSTIQSQLNRN